jgi:hypothetical protein
MFMNWQGFSPNTWQGEPKNFIHHDVYPWVNDLPDNKHIFCCFWLGWNEVDLPEGYDYYIISYENENINIEWLKKQQAHIQGCFIVLHPGYSYNFALPNTKFITYTRLHEHLDKMIQWWGIKPTNPNKTHKFSTISNRLTQSKIWITTQLLETAKNDSFIILNKWLELKNVHNWQATGNKNLDNLTKTFLEKYQSLEITDNFDQKDNHQRKNSNPYQPAYTDCALHFVGGSFHYSEMNDYVYPGPDIDEKTLKCLLAGVAFVPCGQFETYKFLQDRGLEFNYDFDLSWDNDAGNITRFEKLCGLIQDLSYYSVQELVDKTFESTQYNRNFILDKKFYNNCEKLNQQSVKQLIELVS